MKSLATFFLKAGNYIGLIIIFLIPLSARSHGSELDADFRLISLPFFASLYVFLWVSSRLSNLNERESKRRKILIRYFPLWSVPIFLLVWKGARIIAYHT
jgi:hypothetical protein